MEERERGEKDESFFPAGEKAGGEDDVSKMADVEKNLGV